MGELFRRFWLPVMLPEELPEPDCPPIRIKIMGEYLVAFRDTNGQVGMVEAFCPHRRAPLFFGRNEECGLRCVYHGWKFDVERPVRRHAQRAGRQRLPRAKSRSRPTRPRNGAA